MRIRVPRTASSARTRETIAIGGGRAFALLRLAIWLALTCVFYAASLRSGEWLEGGVASAVVLMLLPLLTVSYPLDALRELRSGRAWIFDGRARALRRCGQTVAGFADVRRLRLRAVNGSCEELALIVELASGREIKIAEGGARSRVHARGVELARLLGVGLVCDA